MNDNPKALNIFDQVMRNRQELIHSISRKRQETQ